MLKIFYSVISLSLLFSVDYNTQIQPIFNSNCIGCHGSSGGLNLTSYVDKFLFSEDVSILKEVSKVFVSPGVESNKIFLNEIIKRKIPISTDLDLYLSQTKSIKSVSIFLQFIQNVNSIF